MKTSDIIKLLLDPSQLQDLLFTTAEQEAWATADDAAIKARNDLLDSTRTALHDALDTRLPVPP